LDLLGVKLSLRLVVDAPARLVVDAPAGVLTPEVKAALLAHKPALLARLEQSSPAAPPEVAAACRLERLAQLFAEAARDPYTALEREAISWEGSLRD
jgi:hypothetical protein